MLAAVPSDADRPRRLVPAVDRAVRLLAALRDAGQARSLTDLAALLGVHKATALDILLTLRHHGLVVRDPATKRFALGPALASFAAGAGEEWRPAARAALRRLSARTGETTALGVRRGARLLFLDSELGPSDFPLVVPVGRLLPLPTTSLGKVLCAYLAAGELEEVLAAARASGRDPRDPAAFRAQLAAVRAEGYALDRGEHAAGVFGLAAPVWGPTGEVVAGIAVVGLLERLTDRRLAALRAAVVEAAGALSREIGGRVPTTAPSGSMEARG
ncbi:MAG: IclR family transcriptional regulator [Chloroflexi bacterium]|nr:IclR family transcriptional regulator [Chloroflexota bacterium]